MKITYCEYKRITDYEYKMTVHAKEVHSDEYEQKMKFLKFLKKIGYVHEIEKHYSETGWTLCGNVNAFKDCGYCFTGEWDKESD